MKRIATFALSLAVALPALPMVAAAQLITDPLDPLGYTEDQYDRLVAQVDQWCGDYAPDDHRGCVVEQFEAFGELMALGASKPKAVRTAMDVNFGDYKRAVKVAELQSLRRNISLYDSLYDNAGGQNRDGGP